MRVRGDRGSRWGVPDVRLDPTPAHVLERDHELLHVRCRCLRSGPELATLFFYVEDQPAGPGGAFEHRFGVREHPFDIPVGWIRL